MILAISKNSSVSCGEGFMASRPGRIDTHLRLDGIDEECRRKVANIVLQDSLECVDQVVMEGANDQPAQFHFRCAKLAHNLYQAK